MFNRAIQTAFFILLLAFQSVGQQVAPSSGNQPLEPVPSMKKTVGFIRVEFQENSATWNSTGTGFFVSVADKRLPEGQVFSYLVTNRHVALPEEGGQVLRILNTYLRLNLHNREGGEQSVELPLPVGPHLRWYFPADEADDLAVLPIGPDPRVFDYVAVPASVFATKEVVASQRITEGDKVLFSGFFTSSLVLKDWSRLSVRVLWP